MQTYVYVVAINKYCLTYFAHCLTDFAILHFLGAVMTQYVPPANADSPQGRSWKKTNYTIFSNILLKNLLIIKH